MSGDPYPTAWWGIYPTSQDWYPSDSCKDPGKIDKWNYAIIEHGSKVRHMMTNQVATITEVKHGAKVWPGRPIGQTAYVVDINGEQAEIYSTELRSEWEPYYDSDNNDAE